MTQNRQCHYPYVDTEDSRDQLPEPRRFPRRDHACRSDGPHPAGLFDSEAGVRACQQGGRQEFGRTWPGFLSPPDWAGSQARDCSLCCAPPRQSPILVRSKSMQLNCHFVLPLDAALGGRILLRNQMVSSRCERQVSAGRGRPLAQSALGLRHELQSSRSDIRPGFLAPD
jgi:hypothetical protein